MNVIYIAAAIIAAALVGFVLYFICSPMPVVRILRRKMDGEITKPDDYDDALKKIDIIRDLTYTSKYAGNDYDLFLPKEEGRHPLLLWVHGGAFVAGDKSGTENWCVMLASKGYAVATINYCWAPEAAYPAQIIQITEALEAIKNSRHSHRIDFGSVALAGDSAGAYMTAQFAASHSNPKLAEKIGVSSPIDKSAFKCALLFCGPYDVKKMLEIDNKILRLFISRIGWSFIGKKNWKKAPLISTVTPMDFVTEEFPPCYITDGNSWSFESHGKALGEKLRENGVCVKERYFPKEEYGEVTHEYQMDLSSENGLNCFNEVCEFLDEHMKG